MDAAISPIMTIFTTKWADKNNEIKESSELGTTAAAARTPVMAPVMVGPIPLFA
jgi:hypothetical protein